MLWVASRWEHMCNTLEDENINIEYGMNVGEGRNLKIYSHGSMHENCDV